MLRSVRKAVVLCAGEGTRLRPLSFSTPKHLVPVANRPVIRWILDDLKRSGIDEVAIVVSSSTERVFRAAFDEAPAPIQLEFIVQQHPHGIAHAVKCASEFVGDDSFLLYLGDNLFQNGVKHVVDSFRQGEAMASLALVRVDEPERFGVAVLEGDSVCRLVEKPKEYVSPWAIGGAYVLSSAIFTAIENIVPSQRGELEITDALQWLLGQGFLIQAHPVKGWWKDVGLPKDLIFANSLLIQEREQSHAGRVGSQSRIEGHVLLSEGCQIVRSDIHGPCVIGDGARVEDASIGPNVAIGDRCIVRGSSIYDSLILNDARITDVKCLANSIVGQRCRLDTLDIDAELALLIGDDCEVSGTEAFG